MARKLLSLLCAVGLVALLGNCGDPEDDPEVTPGRDAAVSSPDTGGQEPRDAGIYQDAGAQPDAGSTDLDAGEAPTDAGEADAGTEEPDAGVGEEDAGSSTPDAGPAEPLEQCGTPSLTPGRNFIIELNGRAIDFSEGYFWGSYSPGTSQYYAEASFTWTSTDLKYVLDLFVREGFSATCPATITFPDDSVLFNFYDDEQPHVIDVFSTGQGASGTLTLDAYDLAGGTMSISMDCDACTLVGGGNEVVVDGSSRESLQ